MKLLYIANSRIPTTKANGFQVMKMCEAFSCAGADVELWIPRRLNPIKDLPFRYYDMREVFDIKKLPVLDLIPLSKVLGPIANLAESVSFAFFVLFRLSKTDLDLIYSRDQFVLWFLSFFKNNFVHEVHSFPRNPGFYKRIWLRAHRIVTITQGLKSLLVKQGIDASKILVAPDGVDIELFNSVSKGKEELKLELDLPKNDFVIGYVGKFKTLGMEKGIRTMIESLVLLDKDVKMIFVGGEEGEIKDYRALASRFNVLPRCVFIGYQPYAKAVRYIKAMDALAIPFPNKPHYAFYASPLKLFEYMASGRPIIASDLPALREILNEKNALFFKPENAEDFAKAVRMLKASQMLGYHLSQQALADVKQYAWVNRAKKILYFSK
jgi:glycosyltransferase involved in cell wall biosynthesis